MDNTENSRNIYRIIFSHAEAILDFTLCQMEREVNEGWQCFFAKEVFLSEFLPKPLINEVGRHYLLGKLLVEMHSTITRYIRREEPMAFDIGGYFSENGDRYEIYRHNYRNYLEITAPRDPFGTQRQFESYLDLVAKEVIESKVKKEHRHLLHEISFYQDAWWIDVIDRAKLANDLPITIFNSKDYIYKPIRNQSIPLIDDHKYWQNYYSDKKEHKKAMIDGLYFKPKHKPELIIMLMENIAPDFPYAKKLSKPGKIVFMQEGDDELAWVVVFDKDGGPTYHEPQLVLCHRNLSKKITNTDYLFVHSDRHGLGISDCVMWPYGQEIALRYYMPRFRQFIEFYKQMIEEAKITEIKPA